MNVRPFCRSTCAAVMSLAALVVFAADNARYAQIERVLPPTPSPSDRFGWSVDIDGDAMVVSRVDFTPGDGVDGAGIYLYRRNGAVWQFEAQLRPRDVVPVNLHPADVAISGNHVVIGTPNGGAQQEGRAYLWARDETSGRWDQVRVLKSSRPATAYAGFGNAVDIDGNTLVVSASGEPGDDGRYGAAHVFQRGTTGWRHARRIAPPAERPLVLGFGDAVAIGGSHLIVGAGYTTGDNGRDAAGSALVFARNEGGTGRWGFVTDLKSTSPDEADSCGISVGISAGMAAMGCDAPDEVWVKRIDTEAPPLRLATEDPSDNFGLSLDLKRGRLLVTGRTEAADGTGRAYVYRCAGTAPLQCTLYDTLSNTPDDRRYGFDVAIDKAGTVAVSGADGNLGAAEGGAVFVHTEAVP